jgi:hypothetical protein
MRDRRNWLKSLGAGKWGRELPDRWDSVEDIDLRRSVNFPRRPNVQPGDRIVMYDGSKRGKGLVFAVAEATSYPYEDEASPSAPWRVEVDVIVAVDHLRHGIPLGYLAVDGREHNVRIRRRSHVQLSDREVEAAVTALNRASGSDAGTQPGRED